MDERDHLGLIEAPALVLIGAHDPATTPEKGDYVAERIPGAQKDVLDAAHLSNVERPRGFQPHRAAISGGQAGMSDPKERDLRRGMRSGRCAR